SRDEDGAAYQEGGGRVLRRPSGAAVFRRADGLHVERALRPDGSRKKRRSGGLSEAHRCYRSGRGRRGDDTPDVRRLERSEHRTRVGLSGERQDRGCLLLPRARHRRQLVRETKGPRAQPGVFSFGNRDQKRLFSIETGLSYASVGIPMRLLTLFVFLIAGCAPSASDTPPAAPVVEEVRTEAPEPAVRVGAAVLADSGFSILKGKRVGLIVNHTAMVGGEHLIDL